MGRSLDDVVLVDNSPLALGLRPENGLLISSWYGDDEQDALHAAQGQVFGSTPRIFIEFHPSSSCFMDFEMVSEDFRAGFT